MSLYLGLDSSTQGFSAIVIEREGDRRSVIFESDLSFDEALPEFGTTHGVLPSRDPAVVVSPPLMWAAALDVMLQRVARAGLDIQRLAAISGSAQQHGSVYLNASAEAALARLDPSRPLVEQLTGVFSRDVAPIWMDSSTACECAEIAEAVGGGAALAERTGSRAFERFTGPQIRKFFKQDAAAYEATARVHLVSSYMASLLLGANAPIDGGDASGTNLMDLRTNAWWPAALEATAPGLDRKLPPIVSGSTVIGRLSRYWQARYGLPPAQLIVWSGDNPSTLVGTGLVRTGLLAISLGTSDTVFGPMPQPNIDSTGAAHVFVSPAGGYMGLTCFRNGSLARERIRESFGLSWDTFSQMLDATPAGNHGRMLLPWFEPEITPRVDRPGLHRHDLAPDDGPGHVRAIVEAQQMALALHARWMQVDVAAIYATGGAAVNRAILQVMADVFGADVYQFDVGNTASLGAALRALHGHLAGTGRPLNWSEAVAGFAEPRTDSRLTPNAANQSIYRNLLESYAQFEARALAQ